MAGHIYKPKCKCPKDKKCTCNASWAYIIDLGRKYPTTGKKWPYKKGGFKTKAAAESAMAQLQVEVKDGTYIKESQITFEEFAPQWKAHYAITNGVKTSTLRVRQHEIDNLMKYFRFSLLKNITKKEYQTAINSLKEKGLAVNTISGIHATGRMIFTLAIEWKLIKKDNDPTAGIKIPQDKLTVEQLENQEEIPEFLEKEQLALFLKTAKEKGIEDDYEMFYTLAFTGMRAGELCALKEADLKESSIKITKTLYNPTSNRLKYEITPPKTKKSIREIEVDHGVTEALQKLIIRNKKLKLQYRLKYHDKGFIFIFSNPDKHPGYPRYVKHVDYRMSRVLKLAGLNEKLSPHSLRHTHTSLLAEAGVPLHEIMDRLGHEDDETTRRIYLHVTKARKKEAAQKFSKLMSDLL